MNIGLAMQLVALAMLLVPADALTVAWVMAAQALSGVAKDLNKMSAKSSIKSLTSEQALFGWVAALTGSKNALKGVGFFSVDCYSVREFSAIKAMLGGLTLIWLINLMLLKQDSG